ncbi:MAG: NAD-dependent epimerase/dehydratase family protein [Cytophagales bacterium]|nr:NAD-dependent epimerase/dehydratase family protein [Cytophagales bacterium]
MSPDNALLTGASGFLGSLIRTHLAKTHEVVTLGRSRKNRYAVDLGLEVPKFEEVYDLVIHAAGRAHSIPGTRREVEAFYRDNLRGSENLLKGLERVPKLPREVVFISSVSVYGKESGEMISEDCPLLGTTPYAVTKIQAESLISRWCDERKIKWSILRLPLVAGRNAPGNLGDMITMLRRRVYIGIGDGASRKSIVLGEDVANYIPAVAKIGGTYNLTDGYHPTVYELEHSLSRMLDRADPFRIPASYIRLAAKIGDQFGGKFPLTTAKMNKLTTTLTYSDAKARQFAGWTSQSVVDYFLKLE